jgi:hypothetical protein
MVMSLIKRTALEQSWILRSTFKVQLAADSAKCMLALHGRDGGDLRLGEEEAAWPWSNHGVPRLGA